MPYVTSIERIGRREERAEMLILLLEHRFGSQFPAELRTRIKEATDAEQLKQWFRLALPATSLEQIQQQIQG